MPALQSAIGCLGLVGFAWAISENRKAASWKVAAAGLVIQFGLALVLLKMPGSREVFVWLNDAVLAINAATKAGTGFVFGYVGGGALPFTEKFPGAAFIFAFQALPIILVVSALSALLFHWRILPWIIRGFSLALQRGLGVGGAVGMAAAANIFIGMIEAPLLIRPYMARLTRSELFMVMSAGMATIAGTMWAIYTIVLGPVLGDAAGHILIACLISAPAALMLARLMVPESKSGREESETFFMPSSEAQNFMEAIVTGTMNGVKLLINVIAMLVVLVALVHLANQILGLLPDWNGENLTLQRILGWIMAPVTWLIGIPWDQAPAAGALMGTKTILNEFIAYLNLAKLPAGTLDPRSRIIMVYALCGFANFGSLGIMIGGLTAMAPERRSEIVGLGLKSILAGTLATTMTGAVVGIIL